MKNPFRPPWWMKFLALCFLVCCCAHPVPPPPPAVEMTSEEAESALGRLLCDACTSGATTDECIAHAVFKLKPCPLRLPQCIRKTCVALDDTGRDDFTPTSWR